LGALDGVCWPGDGMSMQRGGHTHRHAPSLCSGRPWRCDAQGDFVAVSFGADAAAFRTANVLASAESPFRLSITM